MNLCTVSAYLPAMRTLYESLVLALCMRRALEEEQPCCRPSTSQLAIFTNPIHPIRMDCSLFSTHPLTSPITGQKGARGRARWIVGNSRTVQRDPYAAAISSGRKKIQRQARSNQVFESWRDFRAKLLTSGFISEVKTGPVSQPVQAQKEDSFQHVGEKTKGREAHGTTQ